MYFLYLDESGDCHSWSQNNNFVIGGVAIHEGQVTSLTNQMNAIQQTYFPGIQVQIPFHSNEIRSGRGRFGKLDRETRNNLFSDLFNVLKNTVFPKAILFSSVMDISKATIPTQDLYTVFSDIASRFNLFLTRGYSRGPKNKGMIIIDHANEDKYMEFFQGYRNNGTPYGNIRNIVDIPYFASGKDTRMIQLADLCAYAVFRRYEHNDLTYFDYIKTKFDRRHQIGPVDGLKHMTESNCECIACSSRT
ncbi:MAG: DUF3800 domain-containing protein [Thermoplasmataceae archaeon]|jgi:hypothetical protein